MDVDEILALERELTDEEFLFLESETLNSIRVVSGRIEDLLPQIAAHDPGLAARMRASTNRMLWAMESGAALPIGDKVGETEALKGLCRQVGRLRGQTARVVRPPRRDRRRRLSRRPRPRSSH